MHCLNLPGLPRAGCSILPHLYLSDLAQCADSSVPRETLRHLSPDSLPHIMTRAHSLLAVLRLTGSEPLTILPLTLETEAAAQAHYKACDRLKLERKQRRMCRRDPGVAETLVEAVSMSALECQYQFRFERWNCTLEGRYRASLLKRGKLCLPPSTMTPPPLLPGSPCHVCTGGRTPSALTESLGPRANPSTVHRGS